VFRSQFNNCVKHYAVQCPNAYCYKARQLEKNRITKNEESEKKSAETDRKIARANIHDVYQILSEEALFKEEQLCTL
jgi:predicted RNA-binding protein